MCDSSKEPHRLTDYNSEEKMKKYYIIYFLTNSSKWLDKSTTNYDMLDFNSDIKI